MEKYVKILTPFCKERGYDEIYYVGTWKNNPIFWVKFSWAKPFMKLGAPMIYSIDKNGEASKVDRKDISDIIKLESFENRKLIHKFDSEK